MKPWDGKIAYLLVRPLRDTRVHPNHLTTLGLALGLTAAGLLASGHRGAMNWGAALFVVSAIVDHADGELARLAGKTSPFGHTYDRAADLVVKLALFAGMGMGVRSRFGTLGLLMGLAAGAALVAIFLMRSEIARRHGTEALALPAGGGFELEDILYVVAPVTWLGLLAPFVAAASIGAPLFALWIARGLRTPMIAAKTVSPE